MIMKIDQQKGDSFVCLGDILWLVSNIIFYIMMKLWIKLRFQIYSHPYHPYTTAHPYLWVISNQWIRDSFLILQS